ncbi:DoxX family membrane protein [Lentibacter algarum]|uniref:DoxX family membrane protein n=1 Tax=Lentibacter algarum TaxID=576131 RepID=UPI001C09F459|nr:DoxX family membrane protein [Lentibacter algarum]MBU2983213.1 DoxX family membrane protein [Lentibacter algarum]
MNLLFSFYNSLSQRASKLAPDLLPLLARFTFAAVLVGYFWASGATKLGDGALGFLYPSTGAYAQIFPRAMEAVTYDTSQLSVFHWLVVVGGTLAEFVLPLLVLVGLFTRLAALAMIGFVALQSLTDLFGHGGLKHPETLGAWFDRMPDSAILDQRAFWLLLLITLVLHGGGWLSLDRLLTRSKA